MVILFFLTKKMIFGRFSAISASVRLRKPEPPLVPGVFVIFNYYYIIFWLFGKLMLLLLVKEWDNKIPVITLIYPVTVTPGIMNTTHINRTQCQSRRLDLATTTFLWPEQRCKILSTQLYKTVHNCTQLYTAVHSCTKLYTTVQNCTKLYATAQLCTSWHLAIPMPTILFHFHAHVGMEPI